MDLALPGPGVWAAVGTASLVVSVIGIAMVPWLVRRLPAGWFDRAEAPLAERLRAHPGRTVAQNLLGFTLLAVGFALLFLPGQGLLTMLLGLLLTDLPVRDRALRWLAHRPPIARALQDLRRSRGLPTFRGLPGA